jgi:membrane protein implicated in regulation of membrane protease activity
VKFFGGFLVGLVTGPLLLIYSIALVIAGAFLGWKFFGEASDEPSVANNQTEQETE